MATFTSRVGLRKPATSDNVTVGTDINNNYDEIDQHLGYFTCTSATRPTGSDRFTGRSIFETDTGLRYIWTGTDWFLLGKKAVRKTVNENVNNSVTLQNDDELVIGLDVGTWEIHCHVPTTGPTAGDFQMDYTFSGTISAHRRYRQGPAGTGNDAANTILSLVAQTAFNTAGAYAEDAAVASYIHEVIIAVVTVAGSLQMRWAQNVATATNTTIFTQAFMTAERLA